MTLAVGYKTAKSDSRSIPPLTLNSDRSQSVLFDHLERWKKPRRERVVTNSGSCSVASNLSPQVGQGADRGKPRAGVRTRPGGVHSPAHFLPRDHRPGFPPVLTITPGSPNRALHLGLFFTGNNQPTANTDYYEHKIQHSTKALCENCQESLDYQSK